MTLDGKKTNDIVVNMKSVPVPADALSPDGEIEYKQVVEFAVAQGLPQGQFIEYQVFYEKAIARPENGRLLEGKTVKIQDGTVFNVTYTDKS